LAAGADRIVLCDTNGGSLPHDLTAAVQKVAAVVPPERLGIHAHNDGGFVREIKRLEDQGFQFDAADGSLALLMKKITGAFDEPFTLECFNVMNGKTGNRPSVCQATIKISVGDEVELTAAEGNGPVNALDHALRSALTKFYPQISTGRRKEPHRTFAYWTSSFRSFSSTWNSRARCSGVAWGWFSALSLCHTHR
jgi:hypothetical protein